MSPTPAEPAGAGIHAAASLRDLEPDPERAVANAGALLCGLAERTIQLRVPPRVAPTES